MSDLNTIVEALENSDYVVDTAANPGAGAVEYVRETRAGDQEVIVVDFRNSLVVKERYNNKGKQLDCQSVNLTSAGNLNMALRLMA